MQPIPLLGLGIQSGFPSVTAQERINCYVELQKDSEKTAVIAYGTPGLELFADLGETPIRGMLTFGDFFYVVHRAVLYKINNAGVSVSLGEIGTTSGRVSMASNGFQIIISDGTTTGYIYDIEDDATVTISNASPGVVTWTAHGMLDDTGVQFSTTGALPSPLAVDTTYYVNVIDADTFSVSATQGGTAINTTDAGSGTHTATSVLVPIPSSTDYPGLTTVAFLDGYFIGNKPLTGQYYISAIYNGLSWNALDFATAEASPDDLVAVRSTRGQGILFGKFTSEIISNTGAQDFPFGRSGIAIEWGLVSPFSIVDVDEYVGFLGKNKLGEVQVCLMMGSQVRVVSTHDLDRILNSNTNLSSATAYSYMLNGHPFYVLNVGGETWMYDLKSDAWSQLISHNIDRHRAEIGVSFIEKIIVSDYDNGRIYRVSDTQYTDNGDPILTRIRGRHIENSRERITINRLEVDFEGGVGLQNGQGENPQAMLRYSKDQGHTWSQERWQSIGKVGEYRHRAFWTRLGRSWDFVLEISISDPVKRCITGVYGSIS